MKAFGFFARIGVVSVFVLGGVAFAQSEATKKKELPQSGMLSATGSSGTHLKTPGVWGGDGLTGGTSESGDSAPISGSVSRTSPGNWKATVQNSSKDTYSADLEVIQVNERGSVVKSDSFSVTLKPGASYERNFSANGSSRQGQLKLKGWKQLTRHAAKGPEAAAEKK